MIAECSLLVEIIQVLIMSEAIKRQDTFKEKLLLCIFACIFLVLAIVLPFRLPLWGSAAVLFVGIISLVCASLLFCRLFKAFAETDTHRVFTPMIQCGIGMVFVVFNMLFYSELFSAFTGVSFLSNDYVCFYSNIIIGVLLILATRAKRIFVYQLVHIILFSFLGSLSLCFSDRLYVNVALYVLFFYVVFQVVMSDKKLAAGIRKAMKHRQTIKRL